MTRGLGAGDCRPRRLASQSAPVWPSGSCRQVSAPAIWRHRTAGLNIGSRWAIRHVPAGARSGRGGKDRGRSIPTTPTCWDLSGFIWRSQATGTKGPRSPKKRSNWPALRRSPSGGGQRRSDIGCEASIPRPTRRFSTRIRIVLAIASRSRLHAAVPRPRRGGQGACRGTAENVSVDDDPRGRCVLQARLLRRRLSREDGRRIAASRAAGVTAFRP